MRVTTAFNKILVIPGAWVVSVTFAPEGVIVGLRRRRRRPVCPCGWKGRAVYDRSIRRWRHLDLGAAKLWLEGEIRRLHCRRCDRVRTEAVDWARPAARLSRDFEDVVAWLAQHTDKTTITSLLRTSWETVAGIVGRVVAEHLDTRRLDGLYRIGVDEVSYRKGHRYLTVVADHDRDGIVVWAGEGHDHTVLERFYDELGPDRCAALEAVSLDMGLAYQTATNHRAGQARQCVDPFHVIKAANTAIDKARRWAWNNERRRHPPPKRPGVAHRKDRRPPRPDPAGSSTPAGRCSKTPKTCTPPSSTSCTSCAANVRCSTAAGNSKKASATSTGSATPTTPPTTSTGGWRGPAAAASPRSSPSRGLCEPTATASSPLSNLASRTRNSKASTARSGSSTTAATDTTPPPPSSP